MGGPGISGWEELDMAHSIATVTYGQIRRAHGLSVPNRVSLLSLSNIYQAPKKGKALMYLTMVT